MSSFPHPVSSQGSSFLERLKLFPISQDPLYFYIWGVSPREFLPDVIFVGCKGGNRGEGPQECFCFCERFFQLLVPFSITCIHEMASFLPHPTRLQFPGNGMGAGREKGWKFPLHLSRLCSGSDGSFGEGDGRSREMESALEGEARRLLSWWYGPNYSLPWACL